MAIVVSDRVRATVFNRFGVLARSEMTDSLAAFERRHFPLFSRNGLLSSSSKPMPRAARFSP
jgi:hypothetical protein